MRLSALLPIELAQAPQEVHLLALVVNQLLDAVRRSLSQEKRFVNDAAHQLVYTLLGHSQQTELAFCRDRNPCVMKERLSMPGPWQCPSAPAFAVAAGAYRSRSHASPGLDMAPGARSSARVDTARTGRGCGFGPRSDRTACGRRASRCCARCLEQLIDNGPHYAGWRAHGHLQRARRTGPVLGG